MTQEIKVRLNQWLITAAVGIISIYSSFKLVQYRLTQTEQKVQKQQETHQLFLQTFEAEQRVIRERFANDKDERIILEATDKDLKHTVVRLNDIVCDNAKENQLDHRQFTKQIDKIESKLP